MTQLDDLVEKVDRLQKREQQKFELKLRGYELVEFLTADYRCDTAFNLLCHK